MNIFQNQNLLICSCKVNEINGWYNMKYERNESSSELKVGAFYG